MNKSIIKLALDSLELRLMQDRQDAKRMTSLQMKNEVIDSINEKLELVRNHQKELEIVQNYIELY